MLSKPRLLWLSPAVRLLAIRTEMDGFGLNQLSKHYTSAESIVENRSEQFYRRRGAVVHEKAAFSRCVTPAVSNLTATTYDVLSKVTAPRKASMFDLRELSSFQSGQSVYLGTAAGARDTAGPDFTLESALASLMDMTRWVRRACGEERSSHGLQRL
ncbi:hypothetical protein BKA62DRAFT_755735 [Auriculariales sp. MPI-PUGE-AT-0066]|nr:hypothetical protein BKA62DRAFT_755735 [Auriculariales sp. MPI-PUGE-AT-0066]